jgi:hypothetical protein
MTDETPRPNRRTLLASMALMASTAAWPARAEEGAGMKHVVLLGDSIFDNKAYVGDGPDVIKQVRDVARLDRDAAARDGAMTSDIKGSQDHALDATHLGCRSAQRRAAGKSPDEEKACSVAEADKLAEDRLQQDYGAMLDGGGAEAPVAVCTIYEARYDDPTARKIAGAGLTIFNDVIMREAFARGVPVIDLRLMFDEDEDYANDIEPSVKGGAKIAKAIATLVTTHDFTRRRSEIYV